MSSGDNKLARFVEGLFEFLGVLGKSLFGIFCAIGAIALVGAFIEWLYDSTVGADGDAVGWILVCLALGIPLILGILIVSRLGDILQVQKDILEELRKR